MSFIFQFFSDIHPSKELIMNEWMYDQLHE